MPENYEPKLPRAVRQANAASNAELDKLKNPVQPAVVEEPISLAPEIVVPPEVISNPVPQAPAVVTPLRKDDQQSDEELIRLRKMRANFEVTIHDLRRTQDQHDADRAEDRKMLHDQNSMIDTLREENKTLRLQPKVDFNRTELNPDQQEQWDDEDVGVMSSVGKHYAQQAVNQHEIETDARFTELNNQLSDMKGKLESSDQQATNYLGNIFYDSLDKLVPGWEQLQEDSRFSAFLGTKHDYMNLTWGDILTNAAKSGDPMMGSRHAAQIYQKFAGANGLSIQGSQEANSELAHSIVPSDSGGVESVPAEPVKKRYSEAAINRWYRDKAINPKRITPEQADKIEREFHLAYMEGRIDYP